MGVKDKVEACGRCAMSSVVSVAAEDEESSATDPFDGPRIEVPEDQMRKVSAHVVTFGRLKDRLNEWATRVTYGRDR